jgi:DNA-binding LacI/PurR family transcriptional regulator
MPSQAKYTEVMSVIERRIRAGDYLLSNIPGERKIAEETGVSYMTARRAVTKLLDQKVLIRQPSGALDIHPSYAKQAKPAEVVLLYPAYASTYLTQLRGLVSDFADKRGVRLRPAQFVHWDESTVVEAAEQARGAFVIPSGAEIPPRLIEIFKSNKVVILDGDFAELELPSIRLFSEENIEMVLQHLYDLGHRHIDCINTQNKNREIERRIDIWQRWTKRKRVKGQLWDNPTAMFTDPTIVSYNLMARLLDENLTNATAMLGTTCPAAIGMMRACWERGVRVGKDISICSINIEPPAEFFCPSITGLNMPNLAGVLENCFDWIFGPDEYEGATLLEPQETSMFEGESTGKSSQNN